MQKKQTKKKIIMKVHQRKKISHSNISAELRYTEKNVIETEKNNFTLHQKIYCNVRR